jgi:hypothetical protein
MRSQIPAHPGQPKYAGSPSVIGSNWLSTMKNKKRTKIPAVQQRDELIMIQSYFMQDSYNHHANIITILNPIKAGE